MDVNSVGVSPVETPSFVVTLIRRRRRPSFLHSDGNQDIPYEIAVQNCQSTDLMSTLLEKAMALDSCFYCGIRMRIFVTTNEGETEFIPFHPSVETMMLSELGISPSNNVIYYTQNFQN